MILWTIQRKTAYEEMLRTGVLRADPEHIFEEFFLEAYEWMADQMKKRIGNPPAGVTLPIWTWYQWEGKRKRLDMRTHGRWSDKGIPIVLLTIEVPDECVLLSDFDYWHVVLNDGELIFPIDDNAVYSKEERQKSWENIFDYERSFDDGERSMGLSTQATQENDRSNNHVPRQQVAFLEKCRKIKGCGSLRKDFYTRFKPKN